MELTRNLTLGIYLPGKTALHCLDPRTKIAGASGLILLLILTNNYAAYASFAAFTIALILAAKIPLRFALKGLRPMLPFLAIMWVFQLLFQKPPGAAVIFSWGIINITDAGLHIGTLMSIRVLLLFLVTTILTLTTSTVELTDGAEALLRPLQKIGLPAQELALTMVITLRFVPTLAEEAEKIIKAQTARGVDFGRGNFIRRTFQLFPVLLPLFINAFKRADELITAMESRCYTGGAGRTKMKVLRMGRSDYLAWVVFAVFAAIQVVLMIKVGRPY
ncbi:MAG TPA: energy-coupling factor transporter transmembrane protein EcfT [Bacillota bacterium]|nr:energy-coupling factor transporter transmembrane protein EcfT [Bacillota bacterium]